MLLGLADNPRPAVPLGQLVFVAADVYVDLFEAKWRKLLSEGDLPATSYISRRDWALRVSHFLHQANRIGFLRRTPYLARSMDTVDATWVDTSLLGHAYFASERSLLTDLGLLVRKGLYPADRGLHPDPAREYWIFPR
jgi:esterase/lipase superfamily enzyme